MCSFKTAWTASTFALLAGTAMAQPVPDSFENRSVRSRASTSRDADSFGASSTASTPYEGAARGAAEVIRSIGGGQLDASEAAVNYQEANRRWIANRVAIEEAYNDILRSRLDRVGLGNELRDERLRRFRELRDAVRSRSGRPMHVHVADAKGRVEWPRPLRSNVLHAHRVRLERLFAQRASTSDVVSVDADLQREIGRLKRVWKGRIREMHPATYLAGKRFINRLETELHHPPAMPEMMGKVAMVN